MPAPAVLWHPELLIAGFLLPVGTGFLVYTLPRFFSAKRGSPWELWGLFLGQMLLSVSILSANAAAVAVLKTLVLLQLAFYAIRRYPRERLAPVFGIFVLAGITVGLVGAIAGCVATFGSNQLPQIIVYYSGTLQRGAFYHGFFWLLFCGMGTRLFPMLTLSTRAPTDSWLKKTLAYSRTLWYLCGAALIASFVVQEPTLRPWLLWLRALAVFFVAWQGWLLFRPPLRRGAVPYFVKFSLLCAVVGQFLVAGFPAHEPSLRHLGLAGGLGLGTLLVMTRVLLAHEGADLVHETRSWPLAVALALMASGALVRAFALAPATYMLQIRVASALWASGLVLWAVCLAVYLRAGKPGTGTVAPASTP